MRKTFKYRIYASQETLAEAEKWLRLCCDLYNYCLAERIGAYRYQRKSLSGYDQTNELWEIKATFPEYQREVISAKRLNGNFLKPTKK